MSRKEGAKIYDSFPQDKKNMPRQEFIEEFHKLTDPAKIAQDAQNIVMNKRNIERGMQN